MKTPALLIALLLPSGLAAQPQQYKSITVLGKEYVNATVSLDDGATAKIVHEAGIARVRLKDLPQDVSAKIVPPEKDNGLALGSVSLDDPSDSQMNENFSKFLASKPDAKVWSFSISSSNANASWFRKFIYDREKKTLLVMRRTVTSVGSTTHYDWALFSDVPMAIASRGIPWMDDSIKVRLSRPSDAKETLPLSYPVFPGLTDWP